MSFEIIDAKKMVGENLKKARKAQFKGLSREKFCKIFITDIEDHYEQTTGGEPPDNLVNLSEGRLKQWEYGVNPIDFQFIPFLCKCLKIDVGFLFGEYEEFTRQVSDVVNETGLTQENAEKLKHYKSDKTVINFLNMFIELFVCPETIRSLQYAIMSQSIHDKSISFNEDNYMYAQQLRMLISNEPEHHYIMNGKEYILPPGAFLIDAGNAAESYIDSITNAFRNFLTEYVKKAAESKEGGKK